MPRGGFKGDLVVDAAENRADRGVVGTMRRRLPFGLGSRKSAKKNS